MQNLQYHMKFFERIFQFFESQIFLSFSRYSLSSRYFGLTYIQAFAGAIIHNWTFYGRELTRFHRLWIATIHFPGRIIKTFAAFFCEVSFAGGFPFQLLLHGSCKIKNSVNLTALFHSKVSFLYIS